jgi:hypothetical protein
LSPPSVNIDGVNYGTTIPVAQLAAAKTTAEVAAIVNPVFRPPTPRCLWLPVGHHD